MCGEKFNYVGIGWAVAACFFSVLCDDDDVICSRRVCVAVYRLKVCSWLCCLIFYGGVVDYLDG